MLNGGNVIQQRRRGIVPAVIAAGIGFTPVAHQAELASVFGIAGVVVGWVTFPGIVIARVAQAQRVANFMSERLATVIFACRMLNIGLIDVVPGLAAQILPLINRVRQESVSLSIVVVMAGAILAVIAEGDIGFLAGGNFGEGKIGHVRPGLQRQLSLLLLFCAELAQPGIAGDVGRREFIIGERES
ncbi:hypothetical protein D3C80_1508570 [compost metagenome]